MGHLHGHRAEFQSTPPLGFNLEFPVDGMGQVLLLCASLKMLEDDTGWLGSKGKKSGGEVEKISSGLYKV